MVVPSVSRKSIWLNKVGVGGEGDVGGRVRKTKVEGWRINVRVERRVERDVSPGAGGGEGMVPGCG